MSEHVYLISISLPLMTLLLIFGMRYYAMIQQAKARLANDDAYRQLAAKAVAAQGDTALALAAITTSLEHLKARVAAVEKVLKEVE
ncbi:hypothetical protein HSX11_14465 [Oxalobacteraceae bacterium]|nr:hypothetical protein [Oxalobacteraceae bacterium]